MLVPSAYILMMATACLLSVADGQKTLSGVRWKRATGMVPDSDNPGPAAAPQPYGSKRAPSGFMGMRGKKELDFDLLEDKRAPKGFLGMRGKKEYDDMSDYYYKRSPSGFIGMRGKKELDLDNFDEDKRGPNSGFYAMRGKKQYGGQSRFFGMRGKKYPYEFRGKFVGVRGKKSETPNWYYASQQEENLPSLDKLLMLLAAANDAYVPETPMAGQDYAN